MTAPIVLVDVAGFIVIWVAYEVRCCGEVGGYFYCKHSVSGDLSANAPG